MLRATIIALCFATCVLGDDALTAQRDLKSPVGLEAIKRYDATYLAARQAYFRTLAAGDKQESADLDRAMRIAVGSTDLDEANRIKAIQESVEARLQQHVEALKATSVAASASTDEQAVKTFEISAHDRWQATIQVQKGRHYLIRASGKWWGGAKDKNTLCGPDGMVIPDGDHQGEWGWYLEGRVNRDYPFIVGSSRDFIAKEDGLLELQMACWWRYGNDGSLQVEVGALPSVEAESN
jgi:hypothetical protein